MKVLFVDYVVWKLNFIVNLYALETVNKVSINTKYKQNVEVVYTVTVIRRWALEILIT